MDFVDSDGIWRQYRGSVSPGRPILFLDRDGVLVEEVHYLHRSSDVRVYPAAIRLVADAKLSGWSVLVVTNQAGIGRGLYQWADFAKVNQLVLETFDSAGAVIDGVLAVPYHSDGVGEYRVDNHPMRKPNPGMILDGLARLGGLAGSSVVVGDRATDLAAGRAAGLGRGLLVRTGYGTQEERSIQDVVTLDFETRIADDLDDFPRAWFKRE